MSLVELTVRAENRVQGILSSAARRMQSVRESGESRTDQAAWLILIPIAMIIAMGLMAAWFLYCQNRGGWPAVNMPNFQTGGVWKVYCAK